MTGKSKALPDTAARQLRRILDVLPRIADGERHDFAEIERLAGVDAELLLRDLRAITDRDDDHDQPGWVESVGIYIVSGSVQLRTAHFRRPMRITRGELAALELGLAMLRAERPHAEHAAIDGARARLRQALAALPDDEVGDPVHAAASPAADREAFATLREALADRRAVRIAYHKGDAPEPRTVHPYALAAVRDAWYLVARCERAADVRIFRLDRLASAERLDAGYEIPDSFSLDDWVRDGMAFRAEDAGVLRVRYGAAIARWIAEREGRPVDADGSITVEHPLADEEWAVRHVLQYGADAEVLEPESVRREIVRRMARLLDGDAD